MGNSDLGLVAIIALMAGLLGAGGGLALAGFFKKDGEPAPAAAPIFYVPPALPAALTGLGPTTDPALFAGIQTSLGNITGILENLGTITTTGTVTNGNGRPRGKAREEAISRQLAAGGKLELADPHRLLSDFSENLASFKASRAGMEASILESKRGILSSRMQIISNLQGRSTKAAAIRRQGAAISRMIT